MRLLVSSLVLLPLVLPSAAQTTYTWAVGVGGSWHAAAMRLLPLLTVLTLAPESMAQAPAFPTDAETLAHYTFDGTAPDTTYDVSGNGHHALNEGTVSALGLHGNARQFDGVADRIDMEAVRMALQGASAWTLEYIARSEAGGTIPVLLSHTCSNGWRLHASGTVVRYAVKTNAGGCFWNSDETLSIPAIGTDWHYFALAFGDGMLRMYMDGALLGERPSSGIFQGSGGGRAWIGHSDFSTGAYFSGYADELRVSTVARPAGEICSTSNALGWACSATAADPDPVAGFVLHAPAPNPSRTASQIRFDLQTGRAVRLAVHDALGRTVAVLADGPRAAGAHTVGLDAGPLAPGVYLAVLTAAGDRVARRLTVAR